MGIATTSIHSLQFLEKETKLDSMSQDFDQNIFSFSNGFERSQQQHQHQQQQQIRRDKVIGMEEDGLPSYESTGIFSDMFSFTSVGASSATELLETQLSQTYRNNPRAADWFLHRHGVAEDGGLGDSKNPTAVNEAASYNQVSSINADSAAAMQLFLMNPQQQRSPSPSPPSTSSGPHMLLPSFQSSAAPYNQFTWNSNPNPGGLSLSLSSEAAKAEEFRLGEGGMLLFGQGGGSTPANYPFKNFVGVSQNQNHRQLGLGPTFNGINIVSSSKYAKAAQDLLEEFCSVGRGHFKKTKPSSGGGAAANSSKDLPPLSASDRLEHQRRKVKLSSMLDEVDRRYNHYCEQMQMVVNSFDMVMGFGAAAPYTSLAQKAMSRHFRCLRDAISDQLRLSCEQLGEKDSMKSGITKGETPRLKFLEQSLRQQRAFHQMGLAEQEAWRPQRGLPERSVGILRAWLFEHFLNPYPSDADKHLLARQTGLSRSQVSNWFINARVRLWKPMVEEMYLQEAKDGSQDTSATTSSASAATAAAKRSEANVHESDPSFVSFNASENHRDDSSIIGASSSSAAAEEEGRKHPAALIRFGASSGDVSLTLGLRHAGNAPEKSAFSVGDFGG